MAVSSMHLAVWSWSRQSPELQTECQNGKERVGLSISQSTQLLGFSHTTISRFYKEGKRGYNVQEFTKLGQLKTGVMMI